MKLVSDIFGAEAPKNASDGDKVMIVATAPSDSKNAKQTYTLTAILKNDGTVDWDKGQCSKPELC